MLDNIVPLYCYLGSILRQIFSTSPCHIYFELFMYHYIVLYHKYDIQFNSIQSKCECQRYKTFRAVQGIEPHVGDEPNCGLTAKEKQNCSQWA